MGKQEEIVSAVRARNADRLHDLLISETTLTLNYSNKGSQGARDVGDDGAITVAKAIKKGGLSLVKIVFWDTGITDRGACALAEVLRHNQHIRHICFSYNRIDNTGAGALADALKTNTILEALDLGANVISNIGASKIAETLLTNNTINFIHLGCPGVTSACIPSFIHALQSNTSLVDLVGNKYFFTLNAELAALLQRNKDLKIKKPLFEICSQTPVVLEDLSQLVSQNPGLVNTTNSEGDTLLHLVVKNSGSLDAVKILLQHGGDPNITSSNIASSEKTQQEMDVTYLEYLTPIEEAFLRYRKTKAETDWLLLTYLIQNRPTVEHALMSTCEAFFRSPSERDINELTKKLTGFNVQSILKNYWLCYQAHLTSVGGFAGADTQAKLMFEPTEEEIVWLKNIVRGHYDEVAREISKREVSDALKKKMKEFWQEVNKYYQAIKSELLKSGIPEKASKNQRDILFQIIKYFYMDKKSSEMDNIYALEGFFHNLYFPLRIRALLHGIVSSTRFPEHERMKEALIKEISLAMEALRTYLESVCLVIKISDERKQNELLDACAHQVFGRLARLKPRCSIYYCAGYQGHAIYIDFYKLATGTIRIRIDNVGAETERHEHVRALSQARKDKPRNLELLPEHYRYPYAFDFESRLERLSTEFKQYLKIILSSNARPPEDVCKWLYPNHSQCEDSQQLDFFSAPLSIEQLEALYPSKRIQTVGNCAVKNHQIGFQIRTMEITIKTASSTETLYHWFRNEELGYLGAGIKTRQEIPASTMAASSSSVSKVAAAGPSSAGRFFSDSRCAIPARSDENGLLEQIEFIERQIKSLNLDFLLGYPITGLIPLLPLAGLEVVIAKIMEPLTPEMIQWLGEASKNIEKKRASVPYFLSRHPIWTSAGIAAVGLGVFWIVKSSQKK